MSSLLLHALKLEHNTVPAHGYDVIICWIHGCQSIPQTPIQRIQGLIRHPGRLFIASDS